METCLLIAGAAITVGTGATVAYARHRGGASTVAEAVTPLVVGFSVTTAAGLALAGNRDRQDRSARAALVGTVTGALFGIGVDLVRGGGGPSRRLTAAVLGAAAGALVAGVYGALTLDSEDATGGGQANRVPTVVLLRVALP